MRREIDILCAGELLVDFITQDFANKLEDAEIFKRIPGGSPANLCMNMARLGNNTILTATVGNDDMGTVLKNYVQSLGVDVTSVAQVEEPTSLILVTRSSTTSNFQAYRAADYMISIRQFPYNLFEKIAILHTTCFGLSRKPAQNVILQAAEKAVRAGVQISLDANYAEKIWPDRKEAQRIVSEYCRMGALVKISDVDYTRLYGENSTSPDAVIEHLQKIGAKEICYTLGEAGLWVANSEEQVFIPSRPIEVKDTTGAGDAFWSGYLTAKLDGKTLVQCALVGRKMAELKLAHFGPLPKKVEKADIYVDLED
jgi:sugar/nucleoside kinase (ribokinase family)